MSSMKSGILIYGTDGIMKKKFNVSVNAGPCVYITNSIPLYWLLYYPQQAVCSLYRGIYLRIQWCPLIMDN